MDLHGVTYSNFCMPLLFVKPSNPSLCLTGFFQNQVFPDSKHQLICFKKILVASAPALLNLVQYNALFLLILSVGCFSVRYTWFPSKMCAVIHYNHIFIHILSTFCLKYISFIILLIYCPLNHISFYFFLIFKHFLKKYWLLVIITVLFPVATYLFYLVLYYLVSIVLTNSTTIRFSFLQY